MVINGTEHGAKVTMAQDGFINMEKAAAVSIGTHMLNKKHGMKNTHILVSCTVWRILFSYVKCVSHQSQILRLRMELLLPARAVLCCCVLQCFP